MRNKLIVGAVGLAIAATPIAASAQLGPPSNLGPVYRYQCVKPHVVSTVTSTSGLHGGTTVTSTTLCQSVIRLPVCHWVFVLNANHPYWRKFCV